MIKTLLYYLGSATFEIPVVMTTLFIVYYIALGVIAFRKPVAGVIIYYGTAIMNPQFHYPIFTALPMAKISAAICLLACLVHMRSYQPRFSVVHIAIAIFVGCSFVSTLSAIDPELTQRRFSEFNNIAIMMVLVAWALKTIDDVDWLYWGVLGSFWFGVLKNLVETQTSGRWYAVRGTGGWLGDSNDWALAVAMSIPLFYGSCFHPKITSKWLRAFMGVTLMAALLVLTITSSRGAFLAAGGSFAALMMTEKKKIRAFAGMGIVFIVVMAYMPASYMSQITSIFDLKESAGQHWAGEAEQSNTYTGAERLYFWRVAYEIMQERPYTGIGWGNFVEQFAAREGLSEGAVTHSSWFQVAAEAGLIAITAYAGMFIITIFSLLKTLRRAREQDDELLALHARVLGAGTVAFMVGGSFISRENSELAFLFIAMSAALVYIKPRRAVQPVTQPAVTAAPQQAEPAYLAQTKRYVRKKGRSLAPIAKVDEHAQPLQEHTAQQTSIPGSAEEAKTASAKRGYVLRAPEEARYKMAERKNKKTDGQ